MGAAVTVCKSLAGTGSVGLAVVLPVVTACKNLSNRDAGTAGTVTVGEAVAVWSSLPLKLFVTEGTKLWPEATVAERASAMIM